MDIGHWSFRGRQRGRGGSVLVIVMMTLLFATFALIAFMERASNDLIVDQREVLARRMRKEAYSSLEVTLAVLAQFREVGQGLHSPAEGWADPLQFAGYTPEEGREVQITFEDESGKISLPRANQQVLINLFKNWQLNQQDAEMLADALMGWMKPDYTYATPIAPDYEMSAIPYEPPLRSLRSYSELADIDKVREFFYDDSGRPNEYYQRFVDAVSLFDFQRPNVNGARPDTLAAVGQFDPTQQQNITDFQHGTGQYQFTGPGFFQQPAEAQRIALGQGGDVSGFASTISALRINVTVIDGRTQFRVSAVIAPQGGAQTVNTNATQQRQRASAKNAQKAGQAQASATKQPTNPRTSTSSTQRNTGEQNLRYPFTLLEIRENDAMASASPPPTS